MRLNALILLTFGVLNEVRTLSILGVFPYQGKTHFFVFQEYLRELARRGHNLTVISHFPQEKPINNYHDISLAETSKVLRGVFPLERSYASIINNGWFLVNVGAENCRKLLAHEQVQQLWKSDIKFDIIVVEQFNSDCSLGLAYKLRAPVVGVNSNVLKPYQYARYGIHYNPSYVSFQFLEGGTRPSLYQRIERTILHIYFNILYKYFSQRIDQNTLAQYFDDIPPLEELARDIKFLLLYNNFVLSGSSLLPSNVKEVGGYHVTKPKELPKDIKKFIEESERGVIYISFGTMLSATTMPIDKLEAIIGAISELPQRIIWKWEEKTLPGNPKNIYLANWLPQNDILAHPNILAFYSHCGLLGTTEAIYHGVPMVGMPVFGDQPANAAAIEESGLGVQIQINDLTKNNLLIKFRSVLDPKFRKNVKLISKIWHDRPMSAMDSAIYWTEFAAKHRNFTFRTRAADVPLYQYFQLDILCILAGILFCIIFMLMSLFSLVTKHKTQDPKNKKSN